MRDEGQEQRAVEAAFIEVLRRHVRGRDHHDAELEQLLEQPAEDHGVGDVGDVELVEAQQPGLLVQGVRDDGDGVAFLDAALLHVVAHGEDALVHVGHEFVEMGAALALPHRHGFKEQVDQHGLAAADRAVDVEAADFRDGVVAAGEQPAERRGLAGETANGEALLQLRERGHHLGLARIGHDVAGCHARDIARSEHRAAGLRHKLHNGLPPYCGARLASARRARKRVDT